jgi:hypothetical protein
MRCEIVDPVDFYKGGAEKAEGEMRTISFVYADVQIYFLRAGEGSIGIVSAAVRRICDVICGGSGFGVAAFEGVTSDDGWGFCGCCGC